MEHNRRSFLLGVAAAAASAGFVVGGLHFPTARAAQAQAQGGRKIVMVAGKRVKVDSELDDEANTPFAVAINTRPFWSSPMP